MTIKVIYKSPQKELKTLVFWQDALCELCLGFILLSFKLTASLNPGSSTNLAPLQPAVMTVFIVTALIEAFGHISKSLMNPALTYSMVLIGRISAVKGIVYMMMQCLGACAGAMFASVLGTAEMVQSIKPLRLAPGLTVWQALGIECLISFLNIIVAFGTTDSQLRPATYFFSLPIALAIGTGGITAANLTGASINPIIALGVSVITNKWDNHWVYWASPYLAGTIAVLIYELFTIKRASHKDSYNLKHDGHAASKEDCHTEATTSEMSLVKREAFHFTNHL